MKMLVKNDSDLCNAAEDWGKLTIDDHDLKRGI